MRFVWIALLVVVVAGGALRFNAAATPSNYQSKDERSYAILAKYLVDNQTYGDNFMSDPVHWVPGAPVMFAAAYAIDHRYTSKARPDIPGAYRWQAVVGTLLIGATFALGLLLAGQIAGLVAAAAVAFYPPLINASADLLSEPLGALLATLALAATIWAIRAPGRLHWRTVLAGALFGATVLTRADLALLPLVGALAMAGAAWRTQASRRPAAIAAARASAPLLGALVVLVLPWTIYASQDAGAFVPLSNGGGSNLFIGTYLPGDGRLFGMKKALAEETKQAFPQFRSVRSYSQISALKTIEAVARRRPELRPEAALKAEGVANLRRYALGQPVAFAGMMVSKVWRLWGGYSVGTSNTRRTAVLAYHRILLLLGVAGLLIGLLVTRRRVLLLPLGALLYVSALNSILVSEARHNLTLIPTLAGAGAAGAVLTVRHLRARSATAPAPVTEPALPATAATATR